MSTTISNHVCEDNLVPAAGYDSTPPHITLYTCTQCGQLIEYDENDKTLIAHE